MDIIYPVTDKFRAREVTELDFDADVFKEHLYVNLDEVRGREYADDIKFSLNLRDDKLVELTSGYIKILFSGHRGSGKTTELQRLHNSINHTDAYYSIFIELEKETVVGSFQPEDLYILIITKLIESLEASGITFESEILNQLASELVTEEEITGTIKKKDGSEIKAEAGASVGFFKFFKLGVDYKASFASENELSNKTRRIVKSKPLEIIRQFNQVLDEIREKVKDAGKGKDIAFIIDGSEKMGFDTYKKLCVEDSVLFKEINCNIIFSVPINAWFNIVSAPMSFTDDYTLPMIKIDGNSHALSCLEDIINKRIDHNSFFEAGVLRFCVEKSGGCIRQLLNIVNRCIVIAKLNIITMPIAEKAVAQLGQKIYERLDGEHLDIIKTGDYAPGKPKVTEMLFGLALLKYNGSIKVNPLLKAYINK